MPQMDKLNGIAFASHGQWVKDQKRDSEMSLRFRLAHIESTEGSFMPNHAQHRAALTICFEFSGTPQLLFGISAHQRF